MMLYISQVQAHLGGAEQAEWTKADTLRPSK